MTLDHDDDSDSRHENVDGDGRHDDGVGSGDAHGDVDVR